MDREIKFRAWVAGHWIEDCNTDPMYYDFQDSIHWEFYEEVEIMQYTGMKDKNGQEIYEGDIVKIHLWEYAGVNEFEYLRIDDFYNDVCYLSNMQHKHIEVIGNIYENPNLLD